MGSFGLIISLDSVKLSNEENSKYFNKKERKDD